MNTTEQIKQYILHDCKMDAVGIAPVSAFDYENGLHTPEHILPERESQHQHDSALSPMQIHPATPGVLLKSGKLTQVR